MDWQEVHQRDGFGIGGSGFASLMHNSLMSNFFEDSSRNDFVDELVSDWVQSVRNATGIDEYFDMEPDFEKELAFTHEELVVDFAFMVSDRVLHDDALTVEEVAQKLNEVWAMLLEWEVRAPNAFNELNADYWRGVISTSKFFYRTYVDRALIRLGKHKNIAWVQDRWHTAKTIPQP